MDNLIVIDDFYSAPNRIRDLALSVPYSDVRELNYPGLQSVYSYSGTAVRQAFSSILGSELEIDESKLTFGRFRLMFANSDSRLKIHADGQADWTGIVYLNSPEQCQGGTAFFRHRASGLSGPPTRHEAMQLGFSNVGDFEAKIVEPDTLNVEAWHMTMFVAMRFNRLVLFRGCRMFHSHTSSWGRGPKDGRLTQNFFFNTAHRISEQPSSERVDHDMVTSSTTEYFGNVDESQ